MGSEGSGILPPEEPEGTTPTFTTTTMSASTPFTTTTTTRTTSTINPRTKKPNQAPPTTAETPSPEPPASQADLPDSSVLCADVAVNPQRFLVPHPTICSKFFSCQHLGHNRFKAHLFNCPVTTQFSSNLMVCNFASPACLKEQRGRKEGRLRERERKEGKERKDGRLRALNSKARGTRKNAKSVEINWTKVKKIGAVEER